MAYDEALAGRIRQTLAGRGAVSERKMFGGIAFMVGGNMACGVIRQDLMVRVGPDAHDAAVAAISHLPLVLAVALVEAVIGEGSAPGSGDRLDWPASRILAGHGVRGPGWRPVRR